VAASLILIQSRSTRPDMFILDQVLVRSGEARGDNIYARLMARTDPIGGVFEEDVAQLVACCLKQEICRVLIECGVGVPLTSIEGYLIISALVDQVPAHFQVAIAASNPNHRRRLDFGVRAIPFEDPQIFIFEAVADAEAWLLQVA
jgi:hypothetical protein